MVWTHCAQRAGQYSEQSLGIKNYKSKKNKNKGRRKGNKSQSISDDMKKRGINADVVANRQGWRKRIKAADHISRRMRKIKKV
jgi:hypothetical protein